MKKKVSEYFYNAYTYLPIFPPLAWCEEGRAIMDRYLHHTKQSSPLPNDVQIILRIVSHHSMRTQGLNVAA